MAIRYVFEDADFSEAVCAKPGVHEVSVEVSVGLANRVVAMNKSPQGLYTFLNT
jgi:hypothetical protein